MSLIFAKGFLLLNLHANKTKESTKNPLGSQDSWQITNSVLNTGKSSIPPLFNDPEVFSYASDKSKLIAKNFSKNSNLDDSDIFLPVFPSTTNLKLYNISKTPKIIKKSHNKPWFINGIWSSLYSSGAPKELWAGTFIHISWTIQYVSERVLFSDCSKVSALVRVVKNVGERYTVKNYHPVSLLSLVRKVF